MADTTPQAVIAAVKEVESSLLATIERHDITFDLDHLVRFYDWNGIFCRTIGSSEAEQYLTGRGWVKARYADIQDNGTRLSTVEAARTIANISR